MSGDFSLRPDPAPRVPGEREADIVAQIRSLLHTLRVIHWKNWGGPLGERGVPDLIGTMQGGRMLLIEVKTTRGVVSSEQEAFVERHAAAGAVAFVARSSREVLERLAAEGYPPAVSVLEQFRQGQRGDTKGTAEGV